MLKWFYRVLYLFLSFLFFRDSLSSAVEGQPTLDEILSAVIKECKKEKVKYKMDAIRCVSAILETHDVDRFKEMSEILYAVLKPVSYDFCSWR